MISIKEALYFFVGVIAQIHDRMLGINDGLPIALTDKDLHFIVIGLFGMALFFIVDPLFKTLARHGYESVASWVYVFTVIIVITFSIEIGQHITHTGTLEFADIVFGVVGFLAFFVVYALIYAIVRLVRSILRSEKRRRAIARGGAEGESRD